MGYQAHISINATKQGQFKGEGIQTARKDKWMPVLSFDMEVVSPRDVATGQASGKRQWRPVKVVKEWGAASPQALLACSTNEVLKSVTVEFTKTNANGQEYVYQTLKLTNGTISNIRRFTGAGNSESSSRHTSANDTMELEEWSMTFQTIEVDDTDGKTSFSDDWAATT